MCICFGLMGIIFIAQNVLMFRFFKTLETRFHDEWTALGRPSLIMGNSLNNSLSVCSFLWKKKYLSLGDTEFTAQCSVVRTFSIFSFTAATIWVICVYIFIMLNPTHA